MRRRIIALLVILVSLMLPGFSSYVERGMRSFDILAQKGRYHDMTVSPIASTSMSDTQGIPFYLTASNIMANADGNPEYGRLIAEWSMTTNYSDVKLHIKATSLVSDNDASRSLDYILGFYYIYPEIIDGSATGNEISGTIKVESGVPSGQYYEFGYRPGGAVNFANRPVRLILTDISDPGELASYPTGGYSATVTLTIEGGVE